jgi:hypothetical protein
MAYQLDFIVPDAFSAGLLEKKVETKIPILGGHQSTTTMAIGIFAQLPDDILKMVEDFTWEDNRMDCMCVVCGRMHTQSIHEWQFCEDTCCEFKDDEVGYQERRAEIQQTVQDFTNVMEQINGMNTIE